MGLGFGPEKVWCSDEIVWYGLSAPRTSKSLPASFGLGTVWEETHACCGLPLRKNFSSVMLDSAGMWFSLFGAEATPLCGCSSAALPTEHVGSLTAHAPPPRWPWHPRARLAWRRPRPPGSCPAAAPSIFRIGDARHGLSRSRTAAVTAFLQPALDSESQ